MNYISVPVAIPLPLRTSPAEIAYPAPLKTAVKPTRWRKGVMYVCRGKTVYGTIHATPTGLREPSEKIQGMAGQGRDSGDQITVHTESAQRQCRVSSMIRNTLSKSSWMNNGRSWRSEMWLNLDWVYGRNRASDLWDSAIVVSVASAEFFDGDVWSM